MSAREIERHRIIEDVRSGRLSVPEAAEKSRSSERSVWRWKAAVDAKGLIGLVHGNRGRAGHGKVPSAEALRIVRIVRDMYGDCTAVFIAEKLRERHGIRRDPKTVSGVLRESGTWESPMRRKGRPAPPHRAWRERRANRGALVQFDGSYHDWFEGRGGISEACLLASIDDASSSVIRAEFAPHEGTLPVMRFWREYGRMHGLPKEIYLDKFSTYRMHVDSARDNQDAKTQLQRAMGTLGVGLVFANSPQAKGRVERLFRTLQDRLVREMRLKGISGIVSANRFLEEEFLPDFNRRFGVRPREEKDFHRLLSVREADDLRETLVRREERVVQRDFTFSFRTAWRQVLPTNRLAVRAGDTVEIREYPEGNLRFFIRNRPLEVMPIAKRPPAETRKIAATLAPSLIH